MGGGGRMPVVQGVKYTMHTMNVCIFSGHKHFNRLKNQTSACNLMHIFSAIKSRRIIPRKLYTGLH